MKKFLKSNSLIWIYFGLALFIELIAVFVTSDKFYIRTPYIYLLLQLFIMLILLSIPSNKARHITSSILLITFMVVNLVFIVIFEMTETIFDFGMFNLRNDGMAILESVPINFTFFAISMFVISLYIVFGGRYVRHAEQPVSIKWWAIPSLIITLAGLGVTLYTNNKGYEQDVRTKLYRSSEASYCEYGVVGNFLNEFVKGTFFNKVKLGDEQQLEDFIYSSDSIYSSNFDQNQEYNVVTVLVESLEWHAFMQDFELFVNGHNINYQNYTDQNGDAYTDANQILSELYPNLYKFYDSSIVLSNFYSREKTDISENFSIMGNYPTNSYINYDFPSNDIPTSMAKTLKILDEDISCKYFHNGLQGFYNRDDYMLNLGFDEVYLSPQMRALGMMDYNFKGERNLDADMIEVCADKMFPTTERFYTYITSITMHGQYTYRSNLAERGYYNDMAQFGITSWGGDSFEAFNHNNFYYYCACVMEFDRALGVMMQELQDRNLIDNTVICLFGDHNTYYSSLSNYVKGIDNTKNPNYTNLFRVPCMIKAPNMDNVINHINTTMISELAQNLMLADNTLDASTAQGLAKQQIENRYIITKSVAGTQVLVKKFMCTADILPTLLDLCGINVYGNLYFGHSALESTTSVLYSRAYDIFITDNMYFVSLNNIKYIRRDNPLANNDPALKYADISNYDSEEHINQVEVEAQILLEKLSACNRIFYNDYFGRTNINDSTKNNMQIFIEKLKAIN